MTQQNIEMLMLLERTAKQEKEPFHRLYGMMYSILLRYLFRNTGNLEDAEDLLNEVMFAVWRSAADFRGESMVSTWILGIANIMCKRWRGQNKLRQNKLQFLTTEQLLKEQLTLEQLTLKQLTLKQRALDNSVEPVEIWINNTDLVDGLARLSSEQRETVELAYFFGYSCEEIATLMDCPSGTVKTRLFHARQRLREFITLYPCNER